VHVWPGSERPLTKHWVSRKLGEILEPVAVKHASLITGVAEGYYDGVFNRNSHLRGRVVTAAMPYGGDEADHRAAEALGLTPYLFPTHSNAFRFVYAGAMLPKAYEPLDRVFRAIANNRSSAVDVEFHFIGSGRAPDDKEGYNIRPLAERYGLWRSVVYEYPARIPYLDVLTHLSRADGVFVLGSTEPHYTPSKVYQAVLSRKPVLAVLHSRSTAAGFLRDTGAGQVLSFEGDTDLGRIEEDFLSKLTEFRDFAGHFDASRVSRSAFDAFSARSSAQILASALDKAWQIRQSDT
ncbi:MAG TPA: hypothetical protein VFS41_05570, partial [Edaphobacter sp.]|nr:hypothetical protein [Edaphobacter sp.]